MTDVRTPVVPEAIARWWSAQECADATKRLRIGDLPTTKRKWNELFTREGMNRRPHCRTRSGSAGGGGREYAFEALPEALQAALMAEAMRANASALVPQSHDVSVRQKDAMAVSLLNERQRDVMHARLAVLTAVEALARQADISRRQAIQATIEAVTTLERRLASGLALSDGERCAVLHLGADGFAISVPAETLRLANDRRSGGLKISRATLYGWFGAMERDGGAGLAPHPTKKAAAPDTAWWWDGFMAFYAQPAHPDITRALERFTKTLDDPSRAPTYKQVRTALGKLNDIERHVGREGLLTLKSRMAHVVRGTDHLQPTSIYIADGKTFDAEVAHPVTGSAFRPEITSVLDVATRKCVAVAISLKENTVAVTEALRKASIQHGIPAIFYADRGPGYKNKALDADASGLMARLSITKMHSLPYNSQARGIIERFNGSVWNPLAKEFPTYLGSDMDREAKQHAHKVSRLELRERGASRLLMDWDEFGARVQAEAVAYNDRPHRGLPRYRDPETGTKRHMSPNAFWAVHCERGWEPILVLPEEADDLFRPYEERVVRRASVSIHANQYFHPALEPLHGQRVAVGYDFDDAYRVWIRELGEAGTGRLICVADYEGNKVDYMPRTKQADAERKRLKGRLDRLGAHVEEAQAEARQHLFIDHRDDDVVAFPGVELPDARAAAVETPLHVTSDEPSRRRFSEDWELALHALQEGLGALHERQRSTLLRCLNTSVDREMFRMKGVDLDRLEALFRDTA